MTKKRRQLIFLWTYVEWGGAQIYFLAIMKEARPDWDIVVILPRNSLPDILNYLDQIGVRYEFIDACVDAAPAPTIKRKLERQQRRIRSEWTTFRYLRRFNLRESILHIEISPWQSWILLTALALRGANVFVTMHNFLPRYSKWRELVWNARLQYVSRLPGFHILASNHDTKNQMKGWVSECFRQKIPVTYTCVNPPEIDDALQTEFDVATARREFGIDKDAFVVLCVGQFIDRKGRWVFLEAATQAAASDKDIRFVWLTPKLPNAEEAQRVAAYGLGDRFKLILSETVGKNRPDVLRFFRIADVFALASFVEGLPIALLEAMALGIPSISTNVYAIPEAVKDMETGILIEAGDSNALAEAILGLKESPELRERLSAQGRAFVMKNFDEREASRIAIAAYKECFADAE